MSTAQDLIDRFRLEFKDPEATAKFDDDTLILFIQNATNSYSNHFSVEAETTLTIGSGLSIDLPTDFKEAVRVEYPVGVILKQRPYKGGDVLPGSVGRLIRSPYGDQALTLSYSIFNNKLWLDRPQTAGESITLWYRANRTLVVELDDELDIPESDDDLIVVNMMYQAANRLLKEDASLRRWAKGPESSDQVRRDDSPFRMLVREYRERWEEGVKGRVVDEVRGPIRLVRR